MACAGRVLVGLVAMGVRLLPLPKHASSSTLCAHLSCRYRSMGGALVSRVGWCSLVARLDSLLYASITLL